MNQPGEDLVIASGPGLPDGLVVPASELAERFSRSPGPGGQSVNTADSRVELTYDPATSSVLTEAQRQRAMSRAPGPVVIAASEATLDHQVPARARHRLSPRLRVGSETDPARAA